MKGQFNIQYQRGETVGTTAWVANKLDSIELKFTTRKTREGNVPSVSYKFSGEEKWKTLMLPICGVTEGFGEVCREYHGIWVNWAVSNISHHWGLFSFLTTAAEEMVNGFIEAVADTFSRYLENDFYENSMKEYKIQVVTK